MQTSSTFLLLVNFLAVSVTAGAGAFGALHSEVDLKTSSEIFPITEKINTLSANRGSGRFNAAQISHDLTAWRGSGRSQPDPADSEQNSQSEKPLAWRGSGRVEPDSETGFGQQIEVNVAWRGSGRIGSMQTDTALDV